MKEFNLSGKVIEADMFEPKTKVIDAEYVKEFIKIFKERTMGTSKLNPIDKARICAEIDKLAGKELI